MAPGVNVDIADLPSEIRERSPKTSAESWINALEREAESALKRGERRIMDDLTKTFERTLILKALAHTGGRRIEAAGLLGLGRNTLTRKIQELGIDERSSSEEN
jgi:two-component system nitrogen regulation response regulator GlnG